MNIHNSACLFVTEVEDEEEDLELEDELEEEDDGEDEPLQVEYIEVTICFLLYYFTLLIHRISMKAMRSWKMT
jgi:hypothetical protein